MKTLTKTSAITNLTSVMGELRLDDIIGLAKGLTWNQWQGNAQWWKSSFPAYIISISILDNVSLHLIFLKILTEGTSLWRKANVPQDVLEVACCIAEAAQALTSKASQLSPRPSPSLLAQLCPFAERLGLQFPVYQPRDFTLVRLSNSQVSHAPLLICRSPFVYNLYDSTNRKSCSWCSGISTQGNRTCVRINRTSWF